MALPKEDIANPRDYYKAKPRFFLNKDIDMELYHVLQFFQRLDAYRANDLLVNKVIGKLFGEVFVYWNVVHFQREPITVKRTEWESAKSLDAFDTWLKRQYPERYQEWTKAAIHASQELFPV